MKIIQLLIICLCSYACSNNENQQKSVIKQNSDKFEIITNSTFRIFSDLNIYDQYELIDKNNQSVFIYTKEGTAIVDEANYDVNYTEMLIFEFNSEIDTFNYSNEELSILNCQYQWRAESTSLKKETRKIIKGNVSGKRINSDAYEISFDIDPSFNFGGYFEKNKTRKISANKQIISVSI